MRRRAVRAAAALMVAAVAIVGVPALGSARTSSRSGPAQSDDAQQHQAGIVNFEFQMPPEPITAGESIVFTNNADRPHTVTDRGGTFDTDQIAPGTTAEVTLDVPGRYEFFCNINPSTMNGTIVVEPGPNPPDATRVQLFDGFREGETRRIDPADLQVDLGTELVVANVGGEQHTFTAVDDSFDSGTIEPGGEQGRFAGTNAEVAMDKVGIFEVFCQFFPDEMRATVTVVDPSATTTTTAAATTTTARGGTTTTADDRSPPDTETAEAIPPPSDDRGIGGGLAAAGVVALGLAAVVIALVPKGGTKPKPKPSEPVRVEF